MLDPVNTKPASKSKVIITAVTAILAILTVAGVHISVSDTQVQQTVDAIMGGVLAIQQVLIIVFRKNSTQAVEGAPGTSTNPAPAILLILGSSMLFGLAGCGTVFGPAFGLPGPSGDTPTGDDIKLSQQQLLDYSNEQWGLALDLLTPVLESRVIKDKNVLATIREIVRQTQQDLNDAQAALKSGDTIKADFLSNKVLGAAKTILSVKKNPPKGVSPPASRPATVPTVRTENPAWIPQRSLWPSASFQLCFSGSLPPRRSLTPATLTSSPTRNVLLCSLQTS
jgi:hypothetical protein